MRTLLLEWEKLEMRQGISGVLMVSNHFYTTKGILKSNLPCSGKTFAQVFMLPVSSLK